jgi:hypothetical protein
MNKEFNIDRDSVSEGKVEGKEWRELKLHCGLASKAKQNNKDLSQ